MNAVAELAFEAIAVEQGHEELEVFFLAVVGRGRHEEEIPGQAGEQLAEPVALGGLDFAAVERRRHLVGFVADDEVPVGLFELLLEVLVAAELVEPADDEVVFLEPVAGPRRLQLVVGHDFEGQMEAAVHFILPLFGEVAGADDHAPPEVARMLSSLASRPHIMVLPARVVGQEEAEGLAGAFPRRRP